MCTGQAVIVTFQLAMNIHGQGMFNHDINWMKDYA